jgi:hypothetical protein
MREVGEGGVTFANERSAVVVSGAVDSLDHPQQTVVVVVVGRLLAVQNLQLPCRIFVIWNCFVM